MKHILFYCLMVLCLNATFPVSFAQDTADPVQATVDNSEAVTVMDSYFRALANGDSASLETLLGGDLLVKRRGLLGNPAYSDHLRNFYQGADFKVLEYESSSPESVSVDALISFPRGETVRRRYLLERSASDVQQSGFVIVGEIPIAGPIRKQGVR
jgi:hypothetical protein